MKDTILGLLAETAIHPGSGQNVGFVDLPVAREAATDYPVIVGSSFKGALLDKARAEKLEATELDCDRVFGQQDNAGSLLVSDVRLVLLPIRSLTSHYKWITCPHLLERLQRDLKRTGSSRKPIQINAPKKGKYLGSNDDTLSLEERQFEYQAALPEGLIDLLAPLMAHADTVNRLNHQLVVLHDDDFTWFARYGLTVNARNVLDEVKKTSKNLWYEETVPPDSLFYCLLAERSDDAVKSIRLLFKKRPYIQAGGNETIGQGWFAVNWMTGGDE